MTKYAALLRGINVGGNKKVPMADLKKSFSNMGCKEVKTILATGNVIFESTGNNAEDLQKTITAGLEKSFGFLIPTIVRPLASIEKIIALDPFRDITLTPDTRLYVSFLPSASESKLPLPFASENGSFRILGMSENAVFSVLDLALTQTPEVMNVLEKEFGRTITTRNWNTVLKIGAMGKS